MWQFFSLFSATKSLLICGSVCVYSPTIWPLTVSLSLGLSLFKSSLWSVEGRKESRREGREEAKTEKEHN